MNVQPKPPTTLTSREFNQDTARAKRAAKHGPVFITERGTPSHVLMSFEEYERIKQPVSADAKPKSLADALADDSPDADFTFEPPRLKGPFFRVPDLD